MKYLTAGNLYFFDEIFISTGKASNLASEFTALECFSLNTSYTVIPPFGWKSVGNNKYAHIGKYSELDKYNGKEIYLGNLFELNTKDQKLILKYLNSSTPIDFLRDVIKAKFLK